MKRVAYLSPMWGQRFKPFRLDVDRRLQVGEVIQIGGVRIAIATNGQPGMVKLSDATQAMQSAYGGVVLAGEIDGDGLLIEGGFDLHAEAERLSRELVAAGARGQMSAAQGRPPLVVA